MLLRKSVTYKNEYLAQSTMLEQALKFFIVFFVVVEPISLIPVFSGLTEGASNAYKHKMALKSVLVASGILLLFALVGAGFLSAMGIAIDSFRIFGGLLLFLIALEMVFARESGTRTSERREGGEQEARRHFGFPSCVPLHGWSWCTDHAAALVWTDSRHPAPGAVLADVRLRAAWCSRCACSPCGWRAR